MMLLPVLVAVFLGSLTLAFVLYPLYRHAPLEVLQQRASASMASTQAEVEQSARLAIKEVEFDFQLGNLAETDYRTWRDRYTRRAFMAMKSRQASEEEIDALIEEQLRQLRVEHDVSEIEEEHETTTVGDDNAQGKSNNATGKDDETNEHI
ncbi:MAG TPA: hypothetical protein VNE38_19105 [Ktedonobacteraceae bacterium]|nr:hypothetical protein [Ktedonobacteraceae bacterium]